MDNPRDLLFEQIDFMDDLEPAAMTLIVDGPGERYIIIYLSLDQYYLNLNGNVRVLPHYNLLLALRHTVITSIKLYIHGQFENIYGRPMQEVPGIVNQILIHLGYESEPVLERPVFQATLNPTLTFNEEADVCSICQEPIYTDMCKNQNCRHYYHCGCIEGWINYDRSADPTCPVCRTRLDVFRVAELYHPASDTFEFGKRKLFLKTLISDLKYLTRQQ